MKRLTGKVLLAAAGLLLGGQMWAAEGEYNLLEQLRPTQVKRGVGNVRLFVPRTENSNDSFGSSRNSFGNNGGFLTDSSSGENNDPTERCLMVSGAITKRSTVPMGYIRFSLQFSRTYDFRGRALKCRFMNLTENRPEAVIVRFFKKDAQQPVWAIQYMDPAFSEGSELVFGPGASGSNVKAVVGQGQANDITKIEFWFGNSENLRHNFRITGLDIVQSSETASGDMGGGDMGDDMGGDMGGQMATSGPLLNRGIRDRLVPGNGQAAFFENGEQSFIRMRGVPGPVEGLEGSWLSFRIDFPKPIRLADKRLTFRCEGLGGVDKLAVRGWREGSEKPVWCVTSTEKAFEDDPASMEQPLVRSINFRLSQDDPNNLTIPDDANLKTAVRSLEFLVSASTLPDGRDLRAEIIGLELTAE